MNAPDDFSIALQSSLSESLTFKIFNDYIKIGYKLLITANGFYTAHAMLRGSTTDILGSRAAITGRLSADASKTLAGIDYVQGAQEIQ